MSSGRREKLISVSYCFNVVTTLYERRDSGGGEKGKRVYGEGRGGGSACTSEGMGLERGD